MADNDQGGGENIELEPYIHQAGMDPDQAKGLFSKLLSEDPDSEAELFSDSEDGRGNKVEEDDEAGGGSRQPRDQQDDDAEEIDDQSDDEEEEEDDLDEEDDDWWEDDDLLDDEEDEGEEDDDQPKEPSRKHTVKVDGEEREVTLQELKDGFSFRAHNTQTAQRLAEERKSLEDEKARVRDERALYAERLDRLGKMLGDEDEQEPDWDKLEREDPAKFAIESAKWSRKQRQRDALREEKERVEAAEAADALERLNAKRSDEQIKLLEALPAWHDANRAEKEQEAIARGAQEFYGYTEAELDLVMDHRAVLMMRDAVRYRRSLAKGKAAVEGKRKRRPRSRMRPGAKSGKGTGGRRKKSSRRQQVSRRRLAESGGVRDAEAAIFDMLDDE